MQKEKSAEERRTHKTGYHLYLYGRRTWHRSLGGAIARARAARGGCDQPQVIALPSGALVYGVPQ